MHIAQVPTVDFNNIITASILSTGWCLKHKLIWTENLRNCPCMNETLVGPTN